MKTLFSRTAILLGFSVIIVSCDRNSAETVYEDKAFTEVTGYSARSSSASKVLTYSTTPLDYSVISDVASHLHRNYSDKDNLDNVVNDVTFLNLTSPLVTKGRAIHQEIMAQIENTEEWNSLPEEDKNIITNFSDDSYATLALFYSFGSDINMTFAKPNPQIMSCIGVALGVVALYDLVVNTAALGTVQTAIGALKLIGRRYLGWIGVAVMIWEFGSCMNGN